MSGLGFVFDTSHRFHRLDASKALWSTQLVAQHLLQPDDQHSCPHDIHKFGKLVAEANVARSCRSRQLVVAGQGIVKTYAVQRVRQHVSAQRIEYVAHRQLWRICRHRCRMTLIPQRGESRNEGSACAAACCAVDSVSNGRSKKRALARPICHIERAHTELVEYLHC